jgi:hypothetical protein
VSLMIDMITDQPQVAPKCECECECVIVLMCPEVLFFKKECVAVRQAINHILL